MRCRFAHPEQGGARAQGPNFFILSRPCPSRAASDPCAKTRPPAGGASAAACAHTGVNRGAYGKLLPATSFNQLTGAIPI